MALIMLVMTESVFCFLVCLLRFGFWVFFFLVRSYFCMVWVFQFEPVKAKLNWRIAEIHFSCGPPIDHLQSWLVCVFIGNHINERWRNNTHSKENDCSCIWVTDSEALFYWSVMETLQPKAIYLEYWCEEVPVTSSSFQLDPWSLCCFFPQLELLHLFRCMYGWVISPSNLVQLFCW